VDAQTAIGISSISVASLAFVRPEVVRLTRRFFKRGSIQLFPNEVVVWSFGPEGLTLRLGGTLRARNRNVFVSSMTIRLAAPDGLSERRLEWRYRVLPEAVRKTPEAVVAMLLAAEDGSPFDVVFTDSDDVRSRILDIQARMYHEWVSMPTLDTTTMRALGVTPGMDARYEALSIGVGYAGLAGELDALLRLTPGIYTVELVVGCETPDGPQVYRGRSEVSGGTQRELSANSRTILREACGLPGPAYAAVSVQCALPKSPAKRTSLWSRMRSVSVLNWAKPR
jgi:hypothetical protein